MDIEEDSQGPMQQMPAIFRQKLKEKIWKKVFDFSLLIGDQSDSENEE